MAVDLENETSEVYQDLTMKHNTLRPGMVMMVGTSHVRLISVRTIVCILITSGLRRVQTGRHALWPSVLSKCVEVIPLTDITDIYKVSTSPDLHNEFIIRKNRSGTTIYLTSTAREDIIKVRVEFNISRLDAVDECLFGRL